MSFSFLDSVLGGKSLLHHNRHQVLFLPVGVRRTQPEVGRIRESTANIPILTLPSSLSLQLTNERK